MPEPRPPALNDIRLRKILDETLVPAHWPEGFVMRCFEPGDAPALHALLTDVFDDGADGNARKADWLYQTGYYFDAKRKGLLEATGLGVDRKRRRLQPDA